MKKRQSPISGLLGGLSDGAGDPVNEANRQCILREFILELRHIENEREALTIMTDATEAQPITDTGVSVRRVRQPWDTCLALCLPYSPTREGKKKTPLPLFPLLY